MLRDTLSRMVNSRYFILLVVISAAAILALRYDPAFSPSNFYAEDGNIFIDGVYTHGYFGALFQLFNGYFVLGEYAVAGVAVLAQSVFGLPFYALPNIVAVVSCLTLGAIVSAPFILFKKELGPTLALVAVLLGALVPMTMFDYAIIGTIGNLKFAFLYLAFLLVIYRILHTGETKKVLIVDMLLLICVLTNITALLVLPAALIPYRNDIIRALKRKRIKNLALPGLISVTALGAISFLYALAVYIHGIPELPGYLEAPYPLRSTIKIIYRVTLYTFLFPLSQYMYSILVVSALASVIYFINRRRENRLVLWVGLWAIFSSTAIFIATRPGIGYAYPTYNIGTTDQFFYAQSLIFQFIVIWSVATYTQKLKHGRSMFLTLTFLFLLLTVPINSSYGENVQKYNMLGTAKENVQLACQRGDKNIDFQIYPTTGWRWSVDRSIACD